jgi:omega-6 fatty acid desaturase (delta-12 desaturase)
MNSPLAPRPETAAEAARAWRASLPRECRRSTVPRGLLFFAVSAGAYVGLFAGSFLLPTSGLRVLALSLMPFAIGAVFVVGHDAAHHSLTPVGWLNRLLGRLSLLPAWHPYTSWAHAHNTLHHGWTNFKGRHPDFAPLSKEEYDALPHWRRALERLYRHWTGIGLCYTFDFYLNYLVFPRGKARPSYPWLLHLDRLLVAAFVALQVAAGWWLSGFTPEMMLPREGLVLLVVGVPWAVWMSFQGLASYIQHTHPRTAWYDNEEEWSFYHVQLKSTTHVIFPWPIERLLNNIMDHPAHHLDPTIPLYELPASQKLLEQRAPEHSVVYFWTPLEHLRTCRKCKLYDYRRHCWLDFNGNPTTSEGLHGLPLVRAKGEAAGQCAAGG